MSRERLEAVANPINQRILAELAAEPGYARRLARMLGMAESEVTRRLRRLQELGLVTSSWEHIGKNVKMYQLVVDEVAVRFDTDGIQLTVTDRDDAVDAVRLAGPPQEGPPETEGFVGRTEELETLAGDASAVVVTGMPGIGKSQLLARYARQATADRAVLWHRFRGPESLVWVARRVASACPAKRRRELVDRIPDGPEPVDLLQAIREALDAEDLVLVLDDVDRIEDDDVARLVEDLVRDPPRAKIVVAARERPRHDPSRDDVVRIHLTGLDDAAVADVLEEHGYDVDDDLLVRVRDEVGGHPLALGLLMEAARRRDGDLDGLLDRVPETDLEAYLLEEIHDRLPDADRRVLALASLFEDAFTEEDLQALTQRRVRPILFNLRRRSLVQVHADGYRLHETVRNFFYELLDDPDPLHERLADHLADRGDLEARLEAMHHRLAAGQPRKVFEMLRDDLDLEEIDYVGAGFQNLYRRVLEQLEPREAPTDRVRALLHDELGDIHLALGDPATARPHHEEAWDHFEDAGEADRIADLAWKRALACRDLGELDRARDLVGTGLEASSEDRTRERLETLRDALETA